MRAALIFPHQLFADHPALPGSDLCLLIEEPLFFRQYRFHAHRLVLQRSALKHYAERLRQSGYRVEYISSHELQRTEDLIPRLQQSGITSVAFTELNDDWLERRLKRGLARAEITACELPDPHFLTPLADFRQFAGRKQKLFFTEFYIQQRKRLGLLIDETGGPVGGQWGFDPENRKKLPKGISIPPVQAPAADDIVRDARRSIQQDFPEAWGDPATFSYPVTHAQAEQHLQDFVRQRLDRFGDYEDALDTQQSVLFHSVLTPALNLGLLSPRQVIEAAVARMEKVPLNSLEGFVRQVIGWREYIRGVYHLHGRRQRTRNFWDHQHPLPAAFYTGSTGLLPVDTVIRRVLATGYCHHIERLMVLGNIMLLCEIHPDAIYQWFMELFVDACDWVMVPNVYGMSQHADGGLITTKPYLSGSSYLLRMSNFPRGPWCAIWDALYWRFIDRHRDFFEGNPRMAMMVRQCDKLGSRLQEHRQRAEQFLEQLHRC